MDKRTQVVVYGSSLHMAGIAASLDGDADLEVVRIDSHSPTLQQRLNELDPAVIALDLSDPSSGLDVRLLHERPGLLLVGVDPASDELLILSSQQERAVAMADLLRVIHRTDLTQEGDEKSREQNRAGSECFSDAQTDKAGPAPGVSQRGLSVDQRRGLVGR